MAYVGKQARAHVDFTVYNTNLAENVLPTVYIIKSTLMYMTATYLCRGPFWLDTSPNPSHRCRPLCEG